MRNKLLISTAVLAAGIAVASAQNMPGGQSGGAAQPQSGATQERQQQDRGGQAQQRAQDQGKQSSPERRGQAQQDRPAGQPQQSQRDQGKQGQRDQGMQGQSQQRRDQTTGQAQQGKQAQPKQGQAQQGGKGQRDQTTGQAPRDQTQGQRGYYKFPDILDVDRYPTGPDDSSQDAVVAARELNLAGLAIERAFTLPVAEPRVRINEFLAGNSDGLQDETLEPQDWIEIFNEQGQSVDLNGWFLTDDPDELTKWPFPPRVLGPHEFLIVFADGATTQPGGGSPLHANFSLDQTGEWLALVRPDGTVASRFAFQHALHREALYARLPAGRRVDLHRCVGKRLAQAYGERAREIAGEVAMHFERGRDAERAIRYLHVAGRGAGQRGWPSAAPDSS